MLVLGALAPAQQYTTELGRSWDSDLVDALEATAVEDPLQRADAIAAYHAWFDARWNEMQEARESAALGPDELREAAQVLFSAAYKAACAEWGLEIDERVGYYGIAAEAAYAAERCNASLVMASRAARLLAKAHRRTDAAALLADAIERYPKAVRPKPHAQVELAQLRRELGDYEGAFAALDGYVEARRHTTEGEAVEWIAQVERGRAYLELGLTDLATPHLTSALESAEQRFEKGEGTARELIQARRMAIQLGRATGDSQGVVELAEAYLDEPELYAGNADELARLQVALGMSLLILEREDPERERRGAAVLERALGGLPSSLPAIQALTALAEVEIDRDEYDAAQKYLVRARERIAAWESKTDQVRPFQEIADLVAFETRLALERGDGPGLLAAHARRLEQAVNDLFDGFSDMPPRAGGVAILKYGRRRAVAGELVRVTEELEGPADALQRVLDLQARGTLARREGAKAPELDDLRDALIDDGAGLLVYLPARECSHLFAIDGERLTYARLAPGATIEKARIDYLGHLLGSAGQIGDESLRKMFVGRERRLASALCELLLPPEVEALLADWSSLTIVGADTLGTVPFAWLPVLEADHLGTVLAISHLPSIPLGVARAQRSVSEKPYDLLLVAASAPAAAVEARWSEAVALPFTGDVERALVAPFPPKRVVVLSGERASLRELARAGTGRARVLQFLGHAVYEPSRERSGALVFHGEGLHDALAWCETIEAWDAPDVVLLTACRSGQGWRRGDPGMTDLGGAWLAGGVQAVLVAQADLRFSSAVESSSVVLERLALGDSPAEALRVARVASVERHGDAAPFRDGLLQFVGLAQQPVFAAPDPK